MRDVKVKAISHFVESLWYLVAYEEVILFLINYI